MLQIGFPHISVLEVSAVAFSELDFVSSQYTCGKKAINWPVYIYRASCCEEVDLLPGKSTIDPPSVQQQGVLSGEINEETH